MEYELKDHLGNVRVTFSDLKLSPTTGGSQPYVPDIRSVNNYYAFGMLQPWRYFQDVSYAGYKFGFNGMMRDDDIKEQTPGISKKGTGNSYDTEFRMYDPRVGRWWSLDPKPTASESWYAGMGNNPIMNTDVNGDRAWIANNHINNNKGWNTPITEEAKISVTKSFDVISNETITYLEKQININFVNVWSDPKDRHYSPKVSNYVKDKKNEIPVAIGNYPGEGIESGEFKGILITIDSRAVKNGTRESNFEGVMLHEIVHKMGVNELASYSAQLAAGYLSPSEFISIIDFNSIIKSGENNQRLYLKQELLGELSQLSETVYNECYNDKGTLIKPDLLVKRMKEYGSEIIGSKNNNNSQNDKKEESNSE